MTLLPTISIRQSDSCMMYYRHTQWQTYHRTNTKHAAGSNDHLSRPRYPKDAGISVAAIEKFSGTIPILGVCLGHQSIAQAFGGDIIHAKQLMHGKASTITVNNQCPVFKHLSDAITVARYHSLIVDETTLPSCLEIIARDDMNQIMAIAHTSHPTYGVNSIQDLSWQKTVANHWKFSLLCCKSENHTASYRKKSIASCPTQCLKTLYF